MTKKYVLLVPDGAADEPLDELGGQTPLAAARTPRLEALAASGRLGTVATVPAGMPPGSDVANLAVLGYEPRAVYTGRAPLEAANIGVELSPCDIAYRCNLVTIVDGAMRDFTAGHIDNETARELMGRLADAFRGRPFEFYAGVSYRNLMVWRDGAETACTPPHDILDQGVEPYLPEGEVGAILGEVMSDARAAIAGRSAATDIWLWGQGRAPQIPLFKATWGLSGAVVGAVDLVKGIGRCAGLEVVDVPGATGALDTDYGAKARAAVSALARHDFVFVHVEAPDEAGHMGSLVEKVKAIERIDAEVLAPLLDCDHDPWVLVVPDHPTPIRLRTHTGVPVPFVYGRAGAARAAGAGRAAFSEAAAGAAGLDLSSGRKLMERFLSDAGHSLRPAVVR
jgi:2,3-bisphosphoglycerate-independent phosphoglycerate mutase